MCFAIDPTAKRPRQRIVYKVMRTKKRSCALEAPVYQNKTYRLGQRAAARIDAKHPTQSNRYAVHGLYVYLTERGAKRYVRHRSHWFPALVVVRCRVKPTDFLHASLVSRDSAAKATYRAVLPLEVIS